jgi:long-chain acyl-CoA synthetase
MLISVPRIYERVFARLQETLAPSPLQDTPVPGVRRRSAGGGFAGAGVAAGGCRKKPVGLAGPGPAWPVLQRLVGRTLLAQFGGRVRVAVSGGAPLSHAVARCFLGLGLPLLQGYGMTETSPVVASNSPDDNDPATVGRPWPA